jgi:ABC-type sugar transport system ATPase subunit
MKGISLHISDGEFVVLVGPSGCGKSTLLRMVAGLEYISSGDISIGDRIVNDLEPKQWDIAMVFHNCVLYPHKTVARNMGFSLTMSGVPKNELKRKVDEAARIPGLEALLDRRPKQLSGGQGQRVAMGRAIVRDPQVFLFDEPLSNLDARLRVQMRAEIKELHQRPGTTTIYVTRDQVEAMPMADKVVVMRSGILDRCCHVNSLSLQVGMPIIDQAAFAAEFHASKASSRWYRMVRAARRLAGTEKRFRVADCMETKRCNPPGDRKPCIARSRFRKGRWLFSARLFSPLWDQWSRPGATSRFAAPYERSLSVMILWGTKPQRFISLTRSRFAARLSRLGCRISSRTAPCWSTARQSQNDRPAIFTTTSSRCQTSPGRGCRRRRLWAMSGPNLTIQRRIVSCETSTPRSSITSSTSRRLKLNRT